MKKILITGCAGFIGFHLTKNFLEKNFKIIGIDSLNNYYSKNLKMKRLNILRRFKNFDFKKIDLKNYDKVHSFLNRKEIDLIIHLAAQPGVRVSFMKPFNTLQQNISTFSNIIEIARIKKVKKFIYASSSSVYGDTKIYPFVENDKENKPISVYGSTKLSNEIIASSYSKNFHISCVGLRFFTVYGPYGRPDMAYYSFLNNLKKNIPINVFNRGIMKRDFTYIDDVIDAIIKVSKTNIKNNHVILNIGKGKPDKLMDLIELLQKNYGKKFKINFKNKIPQGDIKKTFSNISIAKKLINFKPKINLNNGIRKFVDWYKNFYEIR
tara:strand:+ start:2168 stop:3136 length:969 start_codon:yes stop_codon:yes gene_type:complete